MKKGLSWILKSMQDSLSLPQFNGHFKTYTDEYTIVRQSKPQMGIGCNMYPDPEGLVILISDYGSLFPDDCGLVYGGEKQYRVG
jgi:hypothetical protein